MLGVVLETPTLRSSVGVIAWRSSSTPLPEKTRSTTVVRSRFVFPLTEIAHEIGDRPPCVVAAGHAVPVRADEPYQSVAAIDRYLMVFARAIYAVYQQGLDVRFLLGECRVVGDKL